MLGITTFHIYRFSPFHATNAFSRCLFSLSHSSDVTMSTEEAILRISESLYGKYKILDMV